MKRPFIFFFIACAGLFTLPSLTPAEDKPNPTVSTKLQERRVAYRDALVKVVEVMRRRYQGGSDNIDGLLKARIELGHAELAVAKDPAKRIQKLQLTLDALKEIEAFQKARIQVGSGRTDEYHKSIAGRIRGEIMLLEEQQRQSR